MVCDPDNSALVPCRRCRHGYAAFCEQTENVPCFDCVRAIPHHCQKVAERKIKQEIATHRKAEEETAAAAAKKKAEQEAAAAAKKVKEKAGEDAAAAAKMKVEEEWGKDAGSEGQVSCVSDAPPGSASRPTSDLVSNPTHSEAKVKAKKDSEEKEEAENKDCEEVYEEKMLHDSPEIELANLNKKLDALVSELRKELLERSTPLESEQHTRELKRNQMEDQSKWNDFPVLDDRYPLLMLVGKSGFYEEHKGIDLKEYKYVACKLPQLNSDWADNKKANYIEHALREYNILKSLHHPRIVRLQDVFEICNSFCTVLEFCDVHDPDFLPKQNKILKVIRKNIVKMCTELAEEIDEDKVKYKKFYEQFGKSIKLTIREDSANRKKLPGYIRHYASATGDEQSSLDIYVLRMIKKQMSTYYITSRSKDKVGEASGPSRGLRAFNAHWHKDKLPHEARQMAGIQYQLGVALIYPCQLDEVVKHSNDMYRLEATDVGFFNSKSDMYDEYIVASNEMRETFKFMHIYAPYDQFDPGGTSSCINPTGIGGRVEEVLGTINGAGQLGTVLQFSGRIAVGLVLNN